MKVTLYVSLGRYPQESIAELVRLGEGSDDEKIRQLCRKLAERR
ncbi:MAG: hypothetical protein H6Q98_525 [Nitrospirae bacterium]|nr:hypothetical protein [Nitrospirota bacterium]